MIKREKPVRSYSGEKRRTNRTNKKYLSKDFGGRCAYCDDLDSINNGKNSYAVEHFAPKKRFPQLEFRYENLLYSCPFCNSAKSSDWPSDDPTISVVGNCGYVDPCTDEYYSHLDRNDCTGEIYSKSELGEYMYIHLNLFLKRHAIIFMMEKVQGKIEELNVYIKIKEENGQDTENEKILLKELKSTFYEYYCDFQIENNK